MSVQRVLISLAFVLFGAFELWLLGEDLGGIVTGGVLLGIAYLLCSPRAQNLSGLLKIAAILCVTVLVVDGSGALITKAIDGKASTTSGTWLASAMLVWIIVHHNARVSRWVGVRAVEAEKAHG